MAPRRVAREREQSPCALLPHHRGGPQAARRRDRGVEPHLGGSQPRTALRLRWSLTMAWYHEIASSVAALFRRRRQESDMDEEMRFHLEMEAKRNIEAGMPDAEARQRARHDFGG